MGTRIHGMTIQLEALTELTADAFGVPTYSSEWISVDNVLVGQPTDSEIADAMRLWGKKAVYTLGIPKGDTHVWEAGTKVRFFGETFLIFGHTIQGIEDMVPLDWNKKVMVEGFGTGTD